jgi:putative peptidoglycan lipid II flippase
MPEPSSTDARFTRRVGLFSIGTLLSRILGLVRESVFAYLFGAGFATDAFNVAFRIPNFLRDLFAESALSAAFVPAFVRSLREGDREKTWRFASNMLSTVALVTGAISLLGMLASPLIVRVIAAGFAHDPAKLALTTTLTRIMFPFLFFVALAAWAMGILNACGSFFVPAVAPAAFNVFSAALPVATFALFRSRGLNPILGMAWGVTLGAVAQFAVQLPNLGRHHFRLYPVLDFRSPEIRAVFRRWLPMILGLGTWQVNFLVNTFLLTFLREGSVTWVNYAYRIQHLPAGLFGAAIGSVAVAEFSHGTDPSALRGRFRHAMSLVSVLTLPAAALIIALAEPLTRLIYEHGRFTALDTTLTAQALALYCLGIWSAAATRNAAAGFYSQGDTRTPALTALGVVLGNIAMNLVLMRFLGFRSFPLAASITQTLNFLILFLILRRRTHGLEGRNVLSILLRTLLASVLAAVLAWLFARFLAACVPPLSFPAQLLQVLGSGLVGLAAYYLLSFLLRITEVRQAVSDFLSPLLRRP